MAGQLQELAQTDFSGGTSAVTSPYKVGDKQVQRTRNLMLDEHGSLTTRDGYSVLTTSPDTTNPIVLIAVLNLIDGSSVNVALQNDGTVNTLSSFPPGGATWTTRGATSTAYLTPQSVTMLNHQLFAVGYETPRAYDGAGSFPQVTALAGQTLPPGASHLAFHLGYLWLWNTFGSTTTLDGPSSLRTSDANNYGSWPSANQTFISKDDARIGAIGTDQECVRLHRGMHLHKQDRQ